MGLMTPDVVLDVTLTEFENGQIGFQVASYGRPVDPERVQRLLVRVTRSMAQSAGDVVAPPLFADQETR